MPANNAAVDSDDPNSAGPLSALVTAKLVSMLAIFGASLAVGCAPIVLARCLRPLRQPPPDCFYGRLVSLLLCFGGGVLLFTTFLHLLPECRRTFRQLEAAGRIRPLLEYFGIEISEICVCCGFFVVYAVEETVHFVLDRVHRTNRRRRLRPAADRAAIHRTMSMRRCAEQTDDYPDASAPSPQCLSIGAGFGHVLVNGRKLEPEPDSLPPVPRQPSCPLFAETEVSLFDHATDNTAMYRRAGEHDGDDGHVVLTTTTAAAAAVAASSPQAAGQSQTSLIAGHTFSSSSQASANPGDIRAMLRGLLAVLALSVHGVFEGLAVGLEQSPTNVWYMCVALATHKLVVVFCVGMELIGAGVRAACIVVYVCGFAVVTPAGTALGVLLLGVGGAGEEAGRTDVDGGGFEVVAAVLQAMAAGTLLYVIFFEVLARDRSHPHRQAGPAVQAASADPEATAGAERHSHAHRHHYHPDDSGFYRLFAIIAGFLVMFVLHLVTHSE